MSNANPNLLWEKSAELFVRFRWIGFLLAGLVTFVAIPQRNQWKLDQRMETMLIEGDPVREDFEFLSSRFGGSDLVLCVFEIPELWDPNGEGVRKLAQIRRRLAEVTGVVEVMDLSRIEEWLQTFSVPSLWNQSNRPKLLDPNDRISKAMLDLFSGYTHLYPSTTTALLCSLESRRDHAESDRSKTLDRIQQIVNAYDGLETTNSSRDLKLKGDAIGEPIMVQTGFRMIEADGKRLGVISTIFLSVMMLFGFRSIRWTLIAIAIVQWSQLVSEATIIWCDLQRTMVSSMLTALVTVIGVATVIHLMLGYQQEYENGVSAAEAMERSLKKLIQPIALACFTDAIGFLSLLLARVGPVRDYGLMMSIASLVVLLSILLIVPGLATIGSIGLRVGYFPGDAWLRDRLARSVAPLRTHSRGLFFVTLFLLIGALVGSLNVQVETDFIRNFRKDWPMVQAYDRIEENLGGAGVWEVMVPSPSILTDSYLGEVRALENELRQIKLKSGYKLSKVMSIADVEIVSRESPGGTFLPTPARLALMQAAMPQFYSALFASATEEAPQSWLRIMLRSPERATAEEKVEIIRQVESVANRAIRSSNWSKFLGEAWRSSDEPQRAKITGHFVLLTRLIDSLVADQWRCFIAASVGIAIVMWLAVGNIRNILIALVPNILPPLLVLGTMGWLGLRINLGIALIGAVSIGLSVDSTLHYLLRLERERRSGASHGEALEHCQRDVGIAMIVSTLALIVGFGSLATSDFMPTVVFGVTASLTMFGGLLGNLWLMPTLLAPQSIFTNKA